MGKLGDRLRSLLGRKTPPAGESVSSESPPVEQPVPSTQEQISPLAEMLQRRVRRISESFLENESLTADLDDSAAKELLDWGLSLGHRIAQGTADVEDDEQADEAMYPRLRAIRHMMRSVNQWVASQQEGNRESSSEVLNRIIEQAQLIYGRTFKPPSEEQRARFLQTQSEFLDSPPRLIANLRQLFTADDDA
jgi:hypothetical protein